MTTAWLDLRTHSTDDIAEIVEAAIENQIEAVITNGNADKTLKRRNGIQWVAFKDAGLSCPEEDGADISVHSYNRGNSDLLASHLKHSKKDGILVDVTNKDNLEDA